MKPVAGACYGGCLMREHKPCFRLKPCLEGAEGHWIDWAQVELFLWARTRTTMSSIGDVGNIKECMFLCCIRVCVIRKRN